MPQAPPQQPMMPQAPPQQPMMPQAPPQQSMMPQAPPQQPMMPQTPAPAPPLQQQAASVPLYMSQSVHPLSMTIGNKYLFITNTQPPGMYIGLYKGVDVNNTGSPIFKQLSQVQANGNDLTRMSAPIKNAVNVIYTKMFQLPASYDSLFVKEKKGIMSKIGTFMGNKPAARGGTRKNKRNRRKTIKHKIRKHKSKRRKSRR